MGKCRRIARLIESAADLEGRDGGDFGVHLPAADAKAVLLGPLADRFGDDRLAQYLVEPAGAHISRRIDLRILLARGANRAVELLANLGRASCRERVCLYV